MLEVGLQTEGGVQSLCDVAADYTDRMYSQFGQETYCVPQKVPVNQQHPDKALVRTREGEFRSVGWTLSQVHFLQWNPPVTLEREMMEQGWTLGNVERPEWWSLWRP